MLTQAVHTYALGIEFVGTHYRGWQRQLTVPSIQAELERALSTIANHPIDLIAAGRTDAGVHGGNMIAHFCTTAIRSPHNWLRGANTLLPNDIALRFITPMPPTFHARFCAIARRYRYITISRAHRPALLLHKVTHYPQPLAIGPMQHAATTLLGTHDFTSFRAASCESNQPIRHIQHVRLIQHGQFIVFDIQADGFLHHMVRNLMGALLAIGAQKLPPDALTDLIALKDRTQAPPTAPPDGLYFIDARYPPKFQALLPILPTTPDWLGLP